MAKFGVVLVSHSEYIAKGLKELVDEMNDGSVQVVAAGGADGGRIGTSAIKIQQAIESVEDCGHILIYADLGSSILSAETAMD
ncbi:MAG: PTS-dependent dihydroxyacetone kinase phosphotransferase subunit DhaM [Anaerobutyricum soehngenii]